MQMYQEKLSCTKLENQCAQGGWKQMQDLQYLYICNVHLMAKHHKCDGD